MPPLPTQNLFQSTIPRLLHQPLSSQSAMAAPFICSTQNSYSKETLKRAWSSYHLTILYSDRFCITAGEAPCDACAKQLLHCTCSISLRQHLHCVYHNDAEVEVGVDMACMA